MKTFLAVSLLIGLSVGIADADDKATTPPVGWPENDSRLAKLNDAEPKRIGILTYYPNEMGGYTFLEREHIVFYALPYLPTTYPGLRARSVVETRNGKQTARVIFENVNIIGCGTSKMPFGGHTLYRPGFTPGHCQDIPIAKWSRDTPNGKFQLSILAEDSETRLKLKSIVPVLEHAEHAR
jgi:hypothetical protein